MAKLIAIEIDHDGDKLTAFGISYDIEMFRMLAFAEPGTWMRIEEKRDGRLTICRVGEEEERAFDFIAKKGRFKP